ncbi:uncharacterized protein K460DRAFT_364866 [Cucurbitaria berberidis CBS 394.84]|uniref:Uncharacterized protein n=1 Tax=Cucurbitaria berberidis CBS 394.84 TaxID=1168544 RepID=A0A9P4GPA4_9PLEO|nr:uncharacterized protein K460DRAFT_364866 [Cucurbitaria berberidis CBS 394.84]KAF1848926.1 hypothetical protein K460DRAFT_364866 [Cucurbitaria berberidis CBS 394.84]
MDDTLGRQGTHTNRRAAPRSTQPRANASYSDTKYFKFRGSRHRVIIRMTPGYLQVQGNELSQAKTNLQRLYVQERNALTRGSAGISLPMIRASRGTAERRYVNCLVRYLRDANRMSAIQANQLQRNFTRDKMVGMGVSNQDYLLGMYPRELN